MSFAIIDSFGNLFGPFDGVAEARSFAVATLPEDGWEMKPMRLPAALAEGDRT